MCALCSSSFAIASFKANRTIWMINWFGKLIEDEQARMFCHTLTRVCEFIWLKSMSEPTYVWVHTSSRRTWSSDSMCMSRNERWILLRRNTSSQVNLLMTSLINLCGFNNSSCIFFPKLSNKLNKWMKGGGGGGCVPFDNGISRFAMSTFANCCALIQNDIAFHPFFANLTFFAFVIS